MVWVDPLLVFDVRLLRLGHEVVLRHSSQSLLHGSVRQDLLSADLLQLHSIHFIFFLLLFFHELGLSDLLLPLEVDLVDLSLIKALEVVRLHTVGSQHGHLGGRVLSHEIGGIRLRNFNLFLLGPDLVLEDLALLFLLRQSLVYAIVFLFVVSSLPVVLRLGVGQSLVECESLLIEELLSLPLVLLAHQLLSDLLLAPVLLL